MSQAGAADHHQAGMQHLLKQQRALQWLLALLVGFCCAVMAYCINIGIEALDQLRYKHALQFIHHGAGFVLPWLVFNSISCAVAVLAGLGVAYLSPLAAGSGIPHIKAYCNGIDIPELLTFKTLAVKAVGAMVSIGSGIIAGKEGPFIQCGACIAAVLLQLAQQIGNTFSSSSSSSSGAGGGGSRYKMTSRTSSSSWQNTASSSKNLQDVQSEVMSAVGLKVVVGQPGVSVSNVTDNSSEAPTHAPNSSPQLSTSAAPPSTNTFSTMEGSCQEPKQQQLAAEQQQQQQHQLWRQQQQQQQLRHHQVAKGAGAGVAAAFIAPLAGAAYAVEEAASHYTALLMGQAYFVGGVTVLFLWLFTAVTEDRDSKSLASRMFSSPMALAYRGDAGTDVRFWWYVWELPVALLIGALGGLLMAAWTALNTKLQLLRQALLKSGARKVLDVLLVCLITNTLRLAVAWGSPCEPLPVTQDLKVLEEQVISWQFFKAPTGLYPQLWCREGHYSVYGQLFMLPLEVSVRTLFSLQPPIHHSLTLETISEAAQQPQINGSLASGATANPVAGAMADVTFVVQTRVLAAYMAFVWGMLLLSYGIAAPTGIFIPCLALGAAGGRLTGQLLMQLLWSVGIKLPICMPGWSVLGAAAVLTGCTRLTLTNCLIVVESSGAVPMLVPMVLLMVPAKLIADALFTGIYDWQIEQANYPFLAPEDVLSSKQRVVLQRYKVSDIDLADSHECRPAAGNAIEQHAGGIAAAIIAAMPQQGLQDALTQSNASQQQQQQQQQSEVLSLQQLETQQTQQELPITSQAPTDEVSQQQQQQQHQQQLPSTQPAAVPSVPLLMVAADANIGTAYAAFRELRLQELPVVMLLDSSEVNSSGSGSSDGSSGGSRQLPVLEQQQQMQSSVRVCINRQSIPAGEAHLRVIGTLLRKDLLPGAVMKAVKAKLE